MRKGNRQWNDVFHAVVVAIYRIFWSFQGRQIGGLQRVKPNYAHPFASRASFFGAKPPSSEHPKKSHLLKKKCYYSHEIFKVNHLIGEFWCGGNFLLKKSHNSTANCKIVYLVVLLRKFCKPGSANVLCFLNIKKWKKSKLTQGIIYFGFENVETWVNSSSAWYRYTLDMY